ncbi:MAG TPA: aminotransferase class IV [Verrucomicrobiae bacterium]|nr:aminotransferase class IV [Verrucomicrobiae bacterium]
MPEEQAVVSVFDRSFLYGDGLFETMLVRNGKPFRWVQHLERLRRGADFLKIKLPFSAEELRDFAGKLVEKNSMPNALLRLTLSRGVGVRGYSPQGAEKPTLVMSLHPAALALAPSFSPAGSGGEGARRAGEGIPLHWKLITSSHRLPANEPLAQFKTANKLAQILARAEADAAGADEALLISTDGYVAEATSSNLFWIEDGVVCTPPLASGILPGVTRTIVFEIGRSLGAAVQESNIAKAELIEAEAVFLTLSSMGVVEAIELDSKSLKQSPLVEKIQSAYTQLVEAETAA